MAQRAVRRQRTRISVTVAPHLIQAVDTFVAENPKTDRSRVIDDALALWLARQQDQAMEAQFAEPVSETEAAERAVWRRIQDAAATRSFSR